MQVDIVRTAMTLLVMALAILGEACQSDATRVSTRSPLSKPVIRVQFKDRDVDAIRDGNALTVFRHFELYGTKLHTFDRTWFVQYLARLENSSEPVIHLTLIFSGEGKAVTMDDLQEHLSALAKDMAEAGVHKEMLLTFVIRNAVKE
jgi:hypothetical protein